MTLPKALHLLLIFFAGCNSANKEKPVVAVRLIGHVSKAQVETVKQALDSVYRLRIVVLEPIGPPEEAYVNIKTPRYRADKLIAWLKKNKPDSVDYIMGLTSFDISITKKDMWGRIKEPKSRYEDFGIFGLGYCPGKSCVVSNFRLGNNEVTLKNRLAKICVHELGHNFGLPHCKNKSCVMTDAVESITTIDKADMRLCAECRKKI